MNFQPLPIPGAFIIEYQAVADDRGEFARIWCKDEFDRAGLKTEIVQTNLSINRLRGTLRGLHYQEEPYAEDKVIWCTRGRVFDVLVDVRNDSATRGSWCSIELSPWSGRALFVPRGVAHGYQSLEDFTELSYLMSNYFDPSSAKGVRWNDPGIGIRWPIAEPILSARDQSFPDFV